MKRWFHIYVECHSTERFDVQAENEDEARELYENGDALLSKDEVESRDIISVRRVDHASR